MKSLEITQLKFYKLIPQKYNIEKWQMKKQKKFKN